jgi:hypothetical protein
MTPGIKLAFVGIGIAMNLMFLALSWAAGAERRRLLREGQQAPGRVTDITDRKSTRLNSSHNSESRMPSSA